ncbi:glycosyltransferase family 4 protein [Labrenzia sp. VG12]|uniref:glycosyltransferase family 4 protein n=1 Tax=Labrenzia sp. VG12 TaxID=2021862 RepID=UPI000B8C0FB9|nr:glycosyltransferase family 4 protein [Labrenzia sp. VG12]ASP35836.1 glycosyl transferase family 1 [Labrenzia sp. VG12]
MHTSPFLARQEIVHVVRQYAPGIGGLEEFVASLAAQQRGMFAKVRVVTCDRVFSDLETKLAAHEVIDGVEVERIPFLGSTRYPVMPGLWRAIRSADIVHVHGIDFAFDALAATRILHKKPLFVTTHGGFFHTQAYATLKKIWFQTLTRASATGYRAVVCCSESDRETFSKIAGKRVRLIFNGVDIEKFSGAASKTLSRRAVTIGRFSNNKRLDLLLDMFAKLAAQDPEWRLEIFGVPFDITGEELESMVAARNLTQAVKISVGLPVDEIRQALERASFFLSASEYEGFGLALIEAMSAGLIPLVQPNEAYRAFAEEHGDVELCDFSDADAVARKLQSLHARMDENLADSQIALMDAVQTYSWAQTAKTYSALYESCLSRGDIA